MVKKWVHDVAEAYDQRESDVSLTDIVDFHAAMAGAQLTRSELKDIERVIKAIKEFIK